MKGYADGGGDDEGERREIKESRERTNQYLFT
jgi:hypothetical protein